MCFDGVGAESHKCITSCPICFVFTPDSVLQLLSGSSIHLGKVDVFVQIAQMGCGMCQLLCNLWEANREVFQPGAYVSVRRQPYAPPGIIWALWFYISEPHVFPETGTIKQEEFRSWAVPLGVYMKGSGLLDRVLTMTPPTPSVAGDDVFHTFRVRLETCVHDHQECESPSPHHLPTRLLLIDDDVPDRVFVHKCKRGERGNYVALSYCWGTSAQVKLLRSNVDEFSKEGIEIGTLPNTIRDGIIATQKLGIKHLWVDSLCIIQDSIEDKDKEVTSMASIYKNAVVTISAAAATDCGQGFLEDKADVQLRLDRSMCLPLLSTAEEETAEIIDWIYLCPDPHMGHKVKRFSEEAINTRAWTYQESTLSSRLLIFGSGPPQWHCKGSWKIYGLDIHPEHLPNPECTSTTLKITMRNGLIVPDQTERRVTHTEPAKDDIGLWLTWFPVLENYSRRALTYRSDKLLALSALAAEHKSQQNGTYAAGLWSASLPRGLLWRRSSTNGAAQQPQQQQAHPLDWLRARLLDVSVAVGFPEASTCSAQYVAPTWSPMASREPIRFAAAATREENEFHTTLVEINNIHVELSANRNPFGRLDFGYLNVTAPMCSMSWQSLTANFVIVAQGEPFAYWDFIIPDDPAFFEDMGKKYEPSFNPQTLVDPSTQQPDDSNDEDEDEDNFSLKMSHEGVRLRQPVVREPASHECPDADTPFAPVENVKQAVMDALHLQSPLPDSYDATSAGPNLADHEACEFWLLEIERSMNPAGLVLKRVHGCDNIFARVGYFEMNSSLDPETVFADGVQIRGRKTWDWGRGHEGENRSWNDVLTRRRIYLV